MSREKEPTKPTKKQMTRPVIAILVVMGLVILFTILYALKVFDV